MTTPATVPPIVIRFHSPAPLDRAWRAVTEPAEVAKWFADVTPAAATGAPYRVDFGDGSAVEGVIRALQPGRRLAYTWAWAGEDGPTTLVTWDVAPDDGGSRITLTHDGWAQAGVDQATRDDHAGYWEGYLAALRGLLEAEGP